ncbi:MAG TPA: hypothetical protein QF564_21745 [Pirellulaceae bacterium]|nr:hypothetical protein [Pirellulaceae bacterium]
MRIQVATVLFSLALSATVWGDDQSATPKSKAVPAAADKSDQTDQERLFQRFEETLSDVKLVGRFTILGKDDGPLRKEEYTISSVKKMPKGDYWLFNTRIKYGKNDVQVPLPLEVKWAGTTPMITLTDFTVPGLGTFSARVVIYRNKYAGTWSHGEVGGHLFGTIEKNAEDADPTEADKSDDGPAAVANPT